MLDNEYPHDRGGADDGVRSGSSPASGTEQSASAEGGPAHAVASRPAGPPSPFAEEQAGRADSGTASKDGGAGDGADERTSGGAAGESATSQPPIVMFRPPEPAAAQDPEPEPETGADSPQDDEASGGDGARGGRRRRRRGGRGRSKKQNADDGDAGTDSESARKDEDEQATGGDRAGNGKQVAGGKQGSAAAGKKGGSADKRAEPDGSSAQADGDDDSDDETSESSGNRRRRRRRRRAGSPDVDEPAPDDPEETVVRIRSPRQAAAEDEVQSLRGSTRIEAKKQRRREGRELGRRRPPVVTESEFLARRESVERVMVVRQQGERTQIGVLEDGVLVEHYVDRSSGQSYVGNVYLGRVQNVLPSMEAAFVDIGKGRNAVLYAGEVNFDATGLEGQPKRIESALKSGQSVLVQVTKDPVGHKGARLTSQISLPGRYLVYVPGGNMTGISRKLPDPERGRLKQILKKVMPDDAGVIVRTAAEGASEEELTSDIERLAAQWAEIERKSKSASGPTLLHGEPDLTIRVVRDVFNEDFSKLLVAGQAWDTVHDYVDYVAPNLGDRLERWAEDRDVFAAYRIDEQIAKALERKVWLPSGGSLIIERTEAMTVIDVNTGKFTGQGGNLEETVTKNNLEAAEEIVRQLRLRDVGGIIVIDFIDMVLEANRDLVLRRLLECLARDRTKHQVAEVTSLGLVQMTRKRVGQGLLEAFSETCSCCNGRGLVMQTEPVEPGRQPKQAQSEQRSNGRRRRKNGSSAEEAAADSEAAETSPDAHVDTANEGGGDSDEDVAEAAAEAAEAAATVAAAPTATTLDPVDAEPVARRRTRRSTASSTDRSSD